MNIQERTANLQPTDLECRFILGWLATHHPEVLNEALDALESEYRSDRPW